MLAKVIRGDLAERDEAGLETVATQKNLGVVMYRNLLGAQTANVESVESFLHTQTKCFEQKINGNETERVHRIRSTRTQLSLPSLEPFED